MSTASDTTTPAPMILTGDHHDATVELSLVDIADRIRADLCDVQGDDMLPAEAVFIVAADDSGPQNLIRITVSGLQASTANPSWGTARDVVRTVFELAGHYNHFESGATYHARFLTAIDAVTDEGTVCGGFVGAISS